MVNKTINDVIEYLYVHGEKELAEVVINEVYKPLQVNQPVFHHHHRNDGVNIKTPSLPNKDTVIRDFPQRDGIWMSTKTHEGTDATASYKFSDTPKDGLHGNS